MSLSSNVSFIRRNFLYPVDSLPSAIVLNVAVTGNVKHVRLPTSTAEGIE